MTARSAFLAQCGGVFEHSPWIAERAFDSGAVYDPLRAGAVHAALCAIFRQQAVTNVSMCCSPTLTLPASSP